MKYILTVLIGLTLVGCQQMTEITPRASRESLPETIVLTLPSPSPIPIPSPSPSPSASPSPLSLDGNYMYRETRCGATVVASIHSQPSLLYLYKEISGSTIKIKNLMETSAAVQCGVKISRVGTFTVSAGRLEETVQYNVSYPSSCSTQSVSYVTGTVETWDYQRVGSELILQGLFDCDSSSNKLQMFYDYVL